jgi:hypothetical protein
MHPSLTIRIRPRCQQYQTLRPLSSRQGRGNINERLALREGIGHLPFIEATATAVPSQSDMEDTMTDNTAILAGYTREITCVASAHDLHLFVKPDVDLDGRFKAYSSDDCEWIFVSGWLVTDVEVIADYER